MSKSYMFDSPIVTKNTLEHVADIIETNYLQKKDATTIPTAEQLAQIETNKNDISSLKTGKVDKVEGSSLATTAQLEQIETNKTNIESINTQLSGLEKTLTSIANDVEGIS